MSLGKNNQNIKGSLKNKTAQSCQLLLGYWSFCEWTWWAYLWWDYLNQIQYLNYLTIFRIFPLVLLLLVLQSYKLSSGDLPGIWLWAGLPKGGVFRVGRGLGAEAWWGLHLMALLLNCSEKASAPGFTASSSFCLWPKHTPEHRQKDRLLYQEKKEGDRVRLKDRWLIIHIKLTRH